jgi:hypothetical protein
MHNAWGADPQSLPSDEQVKIESPYPLMRSLQPGEAFPVSALGDVLRPMAEAIHDRVQAPMAIGAQSLLAAAALSVQGHADVVLPIGETKPVSLYLITVAESGERKDACDRLAMRPITQYQISLRDQYDIDHPYWLDEKAIWDKAREKALRLNKKGDRAAMRADLQALGPAPPEPLEPLLTCSEPTFEGLCKLFAHGRPSLGIFTAEGGQFIGGHGMTDEAKLRTAAGLSKFWDGTPVDRVRGLDGTLVLAGRRLAMHLMVQPRVADLLLRAGMLIDQGLTSRLLTSVPASTVGGRLWHELQATTESVIQKYGSRLLNILEKPLPLAFGKRNELAPRELPLDWPARQKWIGFADHVELRLGRGGELAPVRGFGNKLAEHAARLAAVLRLIDDIEAATIGAAHMEAGIVLAEYYAAEALRLSEAVRISAQLLKANNLLDWLQDNWEEDNISLPDIYQRGPNAIRDQKTARALVKILEEHGWLIRIPPGAVVSGQHRREAWQIIRRG